jgi:rhamnose transport system ATP-binding protein
MLLHLTAITKSFSGVRALKGVSFDLAPGEVHALVGENGAGKSTLIKIITGAIAPDSGSLVVAGAAVPQMDPHSSRALGIAAIYQQPSVFPHLTVAENIALALERLSLWRRIDWAERRRKAGELLTRIGASIDPNRTAETLSMPEQQLVEIAKAVGSNARVVIMDEPTSSLGQHDVERLFGIILRLRADGVGIIYVSHRLEEILKLADRVTVLRDGESVATRSRDELSHATLIHLMSGRDLSELFPKAPVATGTVALELREVSCRASGVNRVSLTLHHGEILGLAGLVGSGRTELARTVFGLTPADDGEILVDGKPATITSPGEAIELGINYVPEDRRRHGVIGEMSVAANVTMASLPAVSQRGVISQGAEHETAIRYVKDLGIRTASVEAPVEELSGGNQQKVALARALAAQPAVLVLDEPTQGVDVGAKAEIHSLMQTLVSRGMAILMISSELQEVLGMSDRIAVMRGGTVVRTFTRAEAVEQQVLAAALGHEC